MQAILIRPVAFPALCLPVPHAILLGLLHQSQSLPPTPKFRIEQYELYAMTHEVEAATAGHTIVRVFRGFAILVDDSLELVEAAEDMASLPTSTESLPTSFDRSACR